MIPPEAPAAWDVRGIELSPQHAITLCMCQRNCQQLIIKPGINAGNYYAVAVRMKSLWKGKHSSALTLAGRKKKKAHNEHL